MLNVQSNMKEFIKDLDLHQRKQLPFALMKAINGTLFECRKAFIAHVKSKQKSGRAWWNNKQTGVNREFASKEKPKGALTVGMYWADLAEKGGVKHPHKGKYVAIPTDKAPKSRRKAGGARIMANQKKTFFGKGGLYRKKGGKKSRVVERLFTFAKSANVPAWLEFYKTANRAALKKFDGKFMYWLERALRTARR